ncbi:MFS transporter [Lentilactobacillus sp. Marseille-Q4993]|uniref:MFS transporter n=1 Tax=Lentilactobacillus sp. Marseille-Q4993 TaxID=3039492 RepID=UPI0024BC52A0|nr:MFS transporter [Lentilactobacillus sp. Marseille-Q4993]
MKTFRFRFFVLVLISFTLGCGEFLVPGILTNLANSFKMPLASIGLLVTVFALVYAISTPIITIFIGKYRYYKTFVLMMLVYIGGLILSAIATNYILLVISRVVTASVSGALLSVALTFGNAIASEKQRGMMISWVFSGFSIASVVGMPIGTYVTHVANWHVAFGVVVTMSVVTLVLGMLSLPKDLQAGYTKEDGNQFALLKDPLIIVGVLVPLFGSSGINVFHTYVAPIITDELHFGAEMLSVLLSVIGIISIFSSQLSGVLANNHGLKKMPYVFVLQMALFAIVGSLYSNSLVSLLVIFILELTFSLLGSSIEIHFMDVAEKFYPQSMVFASSLNPVFFNLGISVGSASGSMIISSSGLKNLGFGSIGFIVIELCLLTILNKMISRRGLSE